MSQDQIADFDVVLSHFDIFDKEAQRSKWDLFEYARTNRPVTRTDSYGGMWLVTRYEDVRRVLEDWETFSSTQVSIVPLPPEVSLCPLTTDPPVQTAARHLLNPLLSRSALAPYEQRMRETARRLIDSWIDTGRTEVLTQFSGPYVGDVLTKVVFNDMSEDQLQHASHLALEIAEAASPETFAELFRMCTEYLDQARARGVEGDGLLARLINGDTDTGTLIGPKEQVGVLAILISGGLDTTRAAIGSIIYHLTQDPGLEDRLRDPGWVKRDLDEFLRLDSPVAGIARVATRDVELNGVQIKAGERVQVRFDSANWDAKKFHDPGTLVFDEVRGSHAAFGMGVHRCVGSNMARMQIEIAFDELLKRVRNIRLAPGAQPTWVAGNSNSLDSVEIAFDRIEA